MKPARELDAVRRLLAPGGLLFLFYQPPAANRTEELRGRLRRNLEDARFTVAREAQIRGSAVFTSCTEARIASSGF